MDLPEHVPVMVLPDCNLFPHTIMPLFIFEQRYRRMLAEVLESHRMFCMGMKKPAKGQVCGVHDYSTVGLIRACVRNPDGTSHLLLEGVRRVKFVGWCQSEPYPLAKICPVPTARPDMEKQAMLLQALQSQCCQLGKTHCISEALQQAIQECPCPEKLTDLLSLYVVKDALMQQLLLRTECLVKRTELILRSLNTDEEEEFSLG